MKKVIFYQIFVLLVVVTVWSMLVTGALPSWIEKSSLALLCLLIGVVGGLMYCLRAVYLNRCVLNRWSVEWEVWYYIRPITSGIAGTVSYIFLKAGLIILEANQNMGSDNFGFLAFAFIAGLNVDKFVSKIEEVAKSTFGIDKSRSSRIDDE